MWDLGELQVQQVNTPQHFAQCICQLVKRKLKDSQTIQFTVGVKQWLFQTAALLFRNSVSFLQSASIDVLKQIWNLMLKISHMLKERTVRDVLFYPGLVKLLNQKHHRKLLQNSKWNFQKCSKKQLDFFLFQVEGSTSVEWGCWNENCLFICCGRG